MKRIINKKLYDTETARAIGAWDNGKYGNDFGRLLEILYRKKTGEFFLYGEGGHMTKYARSAGNNSWIGGEEIIPLTVEAAREWAEEHLTADEYMREFEVEQDSTDKKLATFYLTERTLDRIARAAQERGIPKGAYIEQLVNPSYICRTWTKTAADGWTSEFSRFATKDEAFTHGRVFVDNLSFDEEARSFEVYAD